MTDTPLTFSVLSMPYSILLRHFSKIAKIQKFEDMVFFSLGMIKDTPNGNNCPVFCKNHHKNCIAKPTSNGRFH